MLQVKKIFVASNCLGLQVIVVSHSWKQKEEFKRVLVKQMGLTKTDPSYYPKLMDLVRELVEEYTNLKSKSDNDNLDSDSS